MMEDKEVGKLWQCAHANLSNPAGLTLWPKAAIDLIRKLVEERANHYRDMELDPPAGLDRALRDFGIPPETWK